MLLSLCSSGIGKRMEPITAAVIATIVIAAVGTFIIISVMKFFIKIRVTEVEEANGLDISEHSESAYPSFTGLD